MKRGANKKKKDIFRKIFSYDEIWRDTDKP